MKKQARELRQQDNFTLNTFPHGPIDNDGGESPSHKSLNNSTISHPNNLINAVSNQLK